MAAIPWGGGPPPPAPPSSPFFQIASSSLNSFDLKNKYWYIEYESRRGFYWLIKKCSDGPSNRISTYLVLFLWEFSIYEVLPSCHQGYVSKVHEKTSKLRTKWKSIFSFSKTCGNKSIEKFSVKLNIDRIKTSRRAFSKSLYTCKVLLKMYGYFKSYIFYHMKNEFWGSS